MSPTLHKLQDCPSLSKREEFFWRQNPYPRYEDDQMHAFLERTLTKDQEHGGCFFKNIISHTLTVMPTRQDVCHKLHKLPYFENSVVGVKMEIEEIN